MSHDDPQKFFDQKICRTEAETIAAAREFAAALPPDSTIALHGDLGAGKTTFVRGLAEAFGVDKQITSPSFNIYTIYDGRERQLIHMDAYRLPSPAAAEGLMLEEFMRTPWCWAVEWAENLGDFLPADAIHISIEALGNGARLLKIVR